MAPGSLPGTKGPGRPPPLAQGVPGVHRILFTCAAFVDVYPGNQFVFTLIGRQEAWKEKIVDE